MRRISGYISAHRPSAEKSVGHVDFFPRNGFALFDRFDHLGKSAVFIDLVVILPVVERAVVVFDERFAEVVFVGMTREACAGSGGDGAPDALFKIGRASCRAGVGNDVEIWVWVVLLKK